MNKNLSDNPLYVKEPKATDMVPVHPKFFTGYDPPPRYYEENDGISITQQDPGMSIQEMIEKYVKGEPVPGSSQEGIYDENEETMNPQNFDLSDLSEAQNVIDAQAIEIAEASSTEDEPSGTESGEDEGQRPKPSDKARRRSNTKQGKAVPKSETPDGSDSEIETGVES